MEESLFTPLLEIFVFFLIRLCKVPNMVTSHLPFVGVKAKSSLPKMTYMAGYYWFVVFEQNLLSHHQSLACKSCLEIKPFFFLFF
jgi:hypothetical protein